MFKAPTSFDHNEWFILVSMILLLIAFFKMPKLMPKDLTLSILLFFAVIGLNADVLMAAGYPFDFYTITDSPKLEIFDVFVYIVNYSIYGYFFAYIMFKRKMGAGVFGLFIIFWSGLTTLIEWIAVKFHVFTYINGWTTLYSSLCYLFIFLFSAAVIKSLFHIWGHDTKGD
ncbi:hypothetical protein CHH80_16020 [Bacillus sp. 7504-2]|nr:hypothetical protein CHH80_16020 [Bacillus sp. 7504-2]